jgi:arylsulfatase A-like enzyme
MWDETLLVFLSDNGGPAAGFNDNMASNWPLRGMKRTLWQVGAGLCVCGCVAA